VAEHFVAFLDRGGIAVTALGSHGIVTAREVGTLGYEQVEAIATGAEVAGGVEAVLIPDTAMHSLQWIDKLEAAVGLPVLTANQVTVWQGLRLLGDVPRNETLGALFRASRG
jgi:maleate cis-trans isomerase